MTTSDTLTLAREYALELLLAIDERQVTHQPRPHAEVVQMLHDLLDLLDGTDSSGDPLRGYFAILRDPDPANDADHPGGSAA